MFKSYLKTSLIALTAIVSVQTAYAEDDVVIFENVENNQTNVSDIFSNVGINSNEFGADGELLGSSFGNTFVLSAGNEEEAGPVIFAGDQQNQANSINADMVLNVDHAENLSFNNEATVNKNVVVSKGFGHNAISSNQSSMGGESVSNVTLNASNVGILDVASTSGGNFGQYVLEGHSNTVNTTQTNNVMQASNVNLDVGSVSTSLNVNSRAWGNSNVIVLGKTPTTSSN